MADDVDPIATCSAVRSTRASASSSSTILPLRHRGACYPDMMRRDQPPRCDVYVCGFPFQTIFHIAPYCDGRSRSSRQALALERLSENTRHLIDLWATSASTRLGRRQATHQMWGHGGGNHHPRCDILWCRTDVVGEYQDDAGHRRRQLTRRRSWKVLGVTAGTIKKPRARVFDTSFGQPLLWAERKTVAQSG